MKQLKRSWKQDSYSCFLPLQGVSKSALLINEPVLRWNEVGTVFLSISISIWKRVSNSCLPPLQGVSKSA